LAVLGVGLIALALGGLVEFLRSSAKNQSWTRIGQVAATVMRMIADPANLPQLLFVIALLVVLALWWLPKLQATHSPGSAVENQFDRENEARKTLAQIIGGIFVLAGLYSSVKTFDLQRQGQITDRFTKAIDQLGALAPGGGSGKNESPKINLGVRLGGIYALERVALGGAIPPKIRPDASSI
jgi:hypothetical protein